MDIVTNTSWIVTKSDIKIKYKLLGRVKAANIASLSVNSLNPFTILFTSSEKYWNWDVDGILYDDYFYPSKTCDLNDYKLYKLNGGLKSLEDFRRDNINKLIRKTYEKIKEVNSDVLFGISPSGNMNNNYNAEYLDINYLIENKIVDFIMPQIYYGFDNTNLPFVNTVNSWSNLVKDTNIKFYVALALYKSGLEDKYAKKYTDEKEKVESFYDSIASSTA